MSDKPYAFHTDPGHGWLEVPLSSCVGLDISVYSYKNETHAFLEEDSDAITWMKHHHVTGRDIRPEYHNEECFIRSLDVYTQEAIA